MSNIEALKIENLVKTYASGFTALKGVDLTVAQGDFFALLGPNGAGKSTTIGILTSLVKKTSGKVNVLGYDLDTQLHDVQSKIGVVPQEFNFSVFEKPEDIIINQAGFYGLPRLVSKQRAEYYLKKLSLWDVRHRPARELSGGMKRRLMIARAMTHEPEMLILDEPTAGVDLEIRRSMWDFVKQINEEQGTTIILTTHYLEEAEQLCRNIAIIDEGKVIEQTNMKTLLSKLATETLILDIEQFNQPIISEDYKFVVVDETTLTVEIDKKQSLNKLFAVLTNAGIVVKSMRNKTNRLEELFLNIVNKTNIK